MCRSTGRRATTSRGRTATSRRTRPGPSGESALASSFDRYRWMDGWMDGCI